MLAGVVKFVDDHPNVKFSPNHQDTSKTNGKRVAKKIRTVSINDLHNDLKKKGPKELLDENGDIKLGCDSFNKLLKKELPELRKATDKHKLTCGCEICIVAGHMQNALNHFRVKKMTDLKKIVANERRIDTPHRNRTASLAFAQLEATRSHF